MKKTASHYVRAKSHYVLNKKLLCTSVAYRGTCL